MDDAERLQERLGSKPLLGTVKNFGQLLGVSESASARLLCTLACSKRIAIRVHTDGKFRKVSALPDAHLHGNPVIEVTWLGERT